MRATVWALLGCCLQLMVVFSFLDSSKLLFVPDLFSLSVFDALNTKTGGDDTWNLTEKDSQNIGTSNSFEEFLTTTESLHTAVPSSPVRTNTTCFIYKRSIIGGLANRIWQIYSTLGMGRTHSCTVLLGKGDFEMVREIFDEEALGTFYPFVATDIFPGSGKIKTFTENTPHRYRPLGLPAPGERTEPIYVDVNGYLQNYKFATNSSDEFARQVQESLLFRPAIVDQAQKLLQNMARCSSDGPEVVQSWIGLHYRRFPDRHKIEFAPPVESTLQHMQTLLDQCSAERGPSPATQCNQNLTLSPCCALVVSNDPDWTKERMSSLSCVRFVENEFLEDPLLTPKGGRNNGWATDFGRDMCILTSVDKLVITVGTFGYFSALYHNKDTSNGRQVYAYSLSNPVKANQHPSSWTLWGTQVYQ